MTSLSAKFKKAIYAGSFDPPTKGHVWMIEQAARLFDELHVAIGTNPSKQPTFTAQRKLAMLEAITKPYKNVRVSQFEERLLVEYAKELGCQYIIRGLRSEADFAYEKTMQDANHVLDPDIQTVYLIAPLELSPVSSSFVKGLVGSKDWQAAAAEYVPAVVLDALATLPGRQ